MIESFSHKGLKLLWEDGNKSKLPAEFIDKISQQLQVIDAATHVPHDFGAFIAWRIHPLEGKYEGFWGLKVSGNWRVIFKFENGNALDVNYVDYH
jgi:toxin HigB-1